ncbi:SUR7/PalI family domain-containing protein [Hirsutella rhossiliensis]|uniref:SUR7/PalI family domain-containing protein n=1 Tax=Hirsutella rhossiliensis TaxID=111463 RepID=A0A9P8SKI0_9HYPO|nr:SUR7/PalI family domain-containing protein [Hirsutella rhossiliensis]KAH0964161.1 SUR7/PalI family domain-containing protein [Hirsutella rhossiliensis]
MLRPATPLSLLLLAAFGLLLLSALSVPVTKFIPMGSFKDAKFGVFGFCKDGGTCSSIGVGYDTEQLLDNDNQAFDLPVSVRDTISVILIVHPVAALLALAMFVMAAASHLHGPGHSARYLLVLFIFILITFLICLLAFLVDVLLFIPHLAWGSYMVLAATIILGLSGIGSCAMRRAVVSRLAHKRRVEENAEMSGENYYTREVQSKPSTAVANQPTLPLFASFENQTKEDRSSDELTQRTHSERSPNAVPYGMADSGQAALRRAPPPRDPGRGAPGYGRGGSMRGRGGYGQSDGRAAYGPPPRDMYGNRGAQGPPSTYNNAGQYDRRPSADAMYYGQQPPQSSLSPGWYAEKNAAAPAFRNDYEAHNPGTGLPRAESPPPFLGNDPSTAVGQPVEMEAAQADAPNTADQYGQMRDNDMDVAGMVGLQQARPRARHETMMTEGSRYSTDEPYVPPRAAWNQAPPNRPGADAAGPKSPPVKAPQDANYYEDVYALYSGPEHADNQPRPAANPGYEGGLAPTGRARSPSESERSNFTSISQRGVNPRWNPKTMQGPQYQNAPPRRMAQQQKQRRQDLLLDNPDFQLPGGRSKGGTHRAGPGMVPGGAYPTSPL